MKKWKIVLPTLLATSGLPLVSLVGCGNEPSVDTPSFEQDGSGEMQTNRTGTFSIDWTPADHSINFTNLSFKCNSGAIVASNVTCPDPTARPRQFQITFDEDIVEDITDGVFSFYYEDITSLSFGNVSVNNIKIDSNLMTIKLDDGEDIPDFKLKDDFMFINAYDGNNPIEGAQFFASTTDTIEIVGNKVTCLAPGTATIICTAEGYNDASYSFEIVGEANNFSTDPWSTVCYHANQGLNHLKQIYAEESFLEKTRKVTINGLEHEVMVIGQEEDFLDESCTKPATLTFQFNNVICAAADQDVGTHWNENGGNEDYWNSTLCDALNNNTDDEVTSVYELIKNDWNNGLAKQIKPIYKRVNIKNGDSWQTVGNMTMLFELRIADFFSAKGINDSDDIATQTEKDLYCAEGNQYTYYKNKIGDAAFDYAPFPLLIRTRLDGSQGNYWFGSPRLWDGHAHLIQEGGEIWYFWPGAWGSMAPCFCI